MSGGGYEKCVGVEIRKIDSSGAPTLDQLGFSQWIVTPYSPVQILKRLQKSGPGGMLDDWDWGNKFVDDDTQVDRDIYEGFEREISNELVSLGVVDYLAGVSVYEVIIYGKKGPLVNLPKRFLVLQSSSPVALFSCSSLNLAWGTAVALSDEKKVSPYVKRLADPLPPKVGSNLSKG